MSTMLIYTSKCTEKKNRGESEYKFYLLFNLTEKLRFKLQLQRAGYPVF